MGIISIMESSSSALVNSVICSGSWNLNPTNHVRAIDFRHLCSDITIRSSDRISWDNTGSNPVSISVIWHSLRPRAAPPSWIKLIWHKFAVPKYSINLWLILKQRLLTKDRMIRFHMNVDAACELCNSHPESHEHLFSTCAYTQAIINNFHLRLDVSWSSLQSGNILVDGGQSTSKNVAFLFVAVTYHAIWMERNHRIFRSRQIKPASKLYEEIQSSIRAKMFSSEAFKKYISKDSRRQLVLY